MVTKETEKMKRKITKLFRLNLTHSGLARLGIGGKVIILSQFFIQILIRSTYYTIYNKQSLPLSTKFWGGGRVKIE